MPASRYTPEQRTETEGPSAVEKKLGIPKGTVTGWAKANGTRTVRNEKTREATEARAVDNKALRALLATDSLKVANKALDLISDRLDTDATDVSLRDLATIYGIFVDKHAVVTKLDAGTQEHSAVDKWLEYITGGTSGDASLGGEVTPRTGEPLNVDPGI